MIRRIALPIALFALVAALCVPARAGGGLPLAQVLMAHDEPGGTTRLAQSRGRLPRRDALRPVAFTLASALTPHIVAVHMTWGAVNEWTTQAAYARLAKLADHPTLTVLLRRIMKQEGRHIDFYATEASGRLANSRAAQRVTRWALERGSSRYTEADRLSHRYYTKCNGHCRACFRK